MKKQVLLIVCLLATIMGYAYDFEVDGIYYVISDNGKIVYVTSGDVKYSGEVVIPSTVTYDGKTYSVTSIGEQAFEDCSGLTSVTIPESITEIGMGVFYGCSGLAKVEISDIAAWCNIEFGNDYANPLFYAHNLYLNGEPLTNLEIPESVTKIGDYAFRSCRGLTSVTIPESVTEIGNYAFESCSGLTSVTIPESVTSIGIGAFFNCSGLTSVTIPESVTEIGDWAFKDCTELMSFTSLNVTPPTLPGETTFEGMSGSCQLYVPESSVMAYQTSTGWTFFSHVNGIPDSGVDAKETETLTVTVEGGAIRVDGAEGAVIEVYSLGGMLLYRGTETTIAMQSGAYLVKVAGTTQKVVL